MDPWKRGNVSKEWKNKINQVADLSPLPQNVLSKFSIIHRRLILQLFLITQKECAEFLSLLLSSFMLLLQTQFLKLVTFGFSSARRSCIFVASAISSVVLGFTLNDSRAGSRKLSISTMYFWAERRSVRNSASSSCWMWSSITVLMGEVVTVTQSTLTELHTDHNKQMQTTTQGQRPESIRTEKFRMSNQCKTEKLLPVCQ